jgi:hypothetical protein
LAQVRKLRGLETIDFIEELEVQGSSIGDVGVIRIKGHLSQQGPVESKPADPEQQHPPRSMHGLSFYEDDGKTGRRI